MHARLQPDAGHRGPGSGSSASTLGQVLKATLEDLRRLTSYRRMIVVGQMHGHVRAIGSGVDAHAVERYAAELRNAPQGDTADPSSRVLDEPVLVRGPTIEGIEISALVESSPDDPDLDRVRDALDIASRFMAQGAEVDALHARVRDLDSRRRRAHSALEALPDPVLVMDHDARIRLANRRAEELFVVEPEDSAGRRHAVEINNLHFSAFRARAAIERPEPAARELVLVDPVDGSDLLFEVAVLPSPEKEGGVDSRIYVLRDISELKLALHELEIHYGRAMTARHEAQRESERLNVIIDSAGVPILVTDPQANVVLMNHEAERLLMTSDRVAGHSRAAPGALANEAKLAGFINEFLLQPTLRREERVTLVDPAEGRDLPTLVVSTKIMREHGEPTAIVTVLHDLTQEVENHRLAEELRTLNVELEQRVVAATAQLAERNALLERQRAELERASRLKSQFLATMSHELRTPINAVLGYNSLLSDGLFGPVAEGQQDALSRMRRAAQQLLDLINDILDLSRVEAGQMQMSAADVDVGQFLEALSDTIRPTATGKSLGFVLEVAPSLPRVRTDITRFRQVMLNLLSNAVKFTDKGSVTVRARAVHGGRRVRVEVIDTGIGIGEEDLERIFEEFTQADQSVTRAHGGTGLGLTISKRLTELMGGELGVTSEPGTGSTFHVELPLEPPAEWLIAEESGAFAYDVSSSFSASKAIRD